ncbi:MAG: MBOAT family protein [Saprospiraceae bacterium]
MVFSSTIFLVYFLPFFLITYWLTPQKFRNITALVWSILFYAWGAPKFIFVLFGSIVIDFFLAKKISQSNSFLKKRYLIISMVLNVGLLLYFKYANFFIENGNVLLENLGMSGVHWAKLALPIGISFFTFQKISYIVDVYRGKNEPLQKLSDLALYIILFPQLIAGPIVRYSEIKDQLQNRVANENIDNRLNGLFRFSIGLAKKMLIANQMSELADTIFNIPAESLTMGQAWLGSLAYAFQIYFDFSGYSDMAIGLGLMMGFRFPENFNAPYISQSITEFWRRWHITLSNWMRDYLYIPLGGNRVKSKTRLYFNLWMVFLISGFWHGAAWTFIAWGIFHGAFLILDRLFLLRFYKKIGKPLSIIITFIITLVGWVIFRAETFPQAMSYIATMFDFGNIDLIVSTTRGTYDWFVELRFLIILIVASFFSFLPTINFIEKNMNPFLGTQGEKDFIILKSFFAIVLLYICMTEVIATGVNPFIYYRF